MRQSALCKKKMYKSCGYFEADLRTINFRLYVRNNLESFGERLKVTKVFATDTENRLPIDHKKGFRAKFVISFHTFCQRQLVLSSGNY